MHTRQKDQLLCPIGGETTFGRHEMFDIINTNKSGLIHIKARNWKFYIEKIF